MSRPAPDRGSALRALTSALVRGSLTSALAPFEILLDRQAPETGTSPVFVVGAPRSGTTLLYQVLTHCYRWSYFTNLTNRLHRTPLVATWLARSLVRRWSSDFESRYGHVGGWSAPSEAGRLWDAWTPGFGPLDESAAAALDVPRIRRALYGTSRLLGSPFVNKNVVHSVHMRLLDRLFPGCVFIEIRRDARDNIRSIVRARAAGGGPRERDAWWSVRPEGAETVSDAHPLLQAAVQIDRVGATIERDARHLGPHRRLRLDYERLCGNPSEVCLEIERFLSTHGIALEQRAAPPTRFKSRSSSPLEPANERLLEQVLATGSAQSASGQWSASSTGPTKRW